MINLDDILNIAIDKNASDIHIKQDSPLILRIGNKLESISSYKIGKEDIENFCNIILSQKSKELFEKQGELDLAYLPHKDSPVRYRVNIFRERTNIEIIMRLIPKRIPTFAELNLPEEQLKRIATLQKGFVLVTGPTGSGKSTTVAAMLEYINTTRACHIITIEDPIEFIFEDKLSSISQREIGIDTSSFSSALKYVLRQDPDVIFIGEMRDYETVLAAINAAETGHLVFSTLHTIDASQTVDRIIDILPSNERTQIQMQFANIIEAIISLRLIERTNGKGRIPAVEIMIGTSTIKSLIKEGKIKEIRNQIQLGALHGMQTFDQSLISLYKKGLISQEDAISYATSPNDVKLAISGIVSSIESAKRIMK